MSEFIRLTHRRLNSVRKRQALLDFEAIKSDPIVKQSDLYEKFALHCIDTVIKQAPELSFVAMSASEMIEDRAVWFFEFHDSRFVFTADKDMQKICRILSHNNSFTPMPTMISFYGSTYLTIIGEA